MNEEEKEAIETVKQYKNCFIFETVHEETGERLNDYSNAIDIVLNLINEQQREIEKLRREKEPSGEFFMSKNGIVIKIIDNRKGDE